MWGKLQKSSTITKRVLVVDDHIVNQKMLAENVSKSAQRLGITVVVEIASNGLKAVGQVRTAKEPFDLILMDLEMPIMNGFDAASLIVKGAKGARPNIFSYTTKPKELELLIAASGLPSPFNGHLNKPCDVKTFDDFLAQALGLPQQSAKAINSAAGQAQHDLKSALSPNGGSRFPSLKVDPPATAAAGGSISTAAAAAKASSPLPSPYRTISALLAKGDKAPNQQSAAAQTSSSKPQKQHGFKMASAAARGIISWQKSASYSTPIPPRTLIPSPTASAAASPLHSRARSFSFSSISSVTSTPSDVPSTPDTATRLSISVSVSG